MSSPKSYDEIVRSTVPEPDSSFRPTKRQVDRAGEEHRQDRELEQMNDPDRALHAQVSATIAAFPAVTMEVERGTVILRGSVPDASALAKVEAIVEAIAGVDKVENRLVIGS
jgi:hypothetical protein